MLYTNFARRGFLFVLTIMGFIALQGCQETARHEFLEVLKKEMGATIDGDELITKDGKRFEKIKWEFAFHKQLRLALKDLEIENIILTAFKKVFHDYSTYSDVERSIIGDWVEKNAKYFGQAIDPEIERFVIQDQRTTNLNDNLKLKIKDFYKEVADTLKSKLGTRPNPDKVLAVLTTTGGGGHKTVADAVESLLATYPNYKSVVVDERSFERDFDPIAVASGGEVSYETVYNVIFQQERDAKRAGRIWMAAQHLLTDYIPLDFAGAVRRGIMKVNPTAIINTLHHRSEYVGISYFHDIPQVIISTDYDIPIANTEAVQKATDRLIRYLLPTDNFSLFAGFYERVTGIKDGIKSNAGMYKNARGQLLVDYFEQKKTDLSYINTLGSLFRVQGIPARPSFDKDRFTAADIASIRANHGVKPGFYPIVVSFGGQGGGTTLEVIKFFIEKSNELSHPIHLISTAANNKKLFSAIEELGFKGNTKLGLTSLLVANQQQMAEIFAISVALLGKPGGLTATECYHMKLPLIALDYHEWELRNLDFLKSFNLGYLVESPWDPKLLAKINELISSPPLTNFTPIKWKDNLVNNINEVLSSWGYSVL
jgi:UDP-N-acetylglucosamine:LPS N-acetylglucosamine transferase